jgi:hypothetical protein
MKTAIIVLFAICILVLLFDIIYTYIYERRFESRRKKKTINNQNAYLERFIEIESRQQGKGSGNPSNN